MSQIPPIQPPPGYSNYPRSSYGSGSYQRPPGVNFDSISRAFTLAQANLGTWVVTMLVCGALYYALVFALDIGFVASGLFFSNGKPVSFDFTFLLLLIPLGLAIACLFHAVFSGLLNMGVKQARYEPISLGDAFACLPDTIPLAVGAFFCFVLTVAGYCLLIVPGIWVSGLLAFVPLLIKDRNLNPVEAIQFSYEQLRQHAWMLFLLVLVAGLIASLGAFLCGIGIILTYPIYFSTLGVAYNDFFPPDNPIVYNQPIGFEPPR